MNVAPITVRLVDRLLAGGNDGDSKRVPGGRLTAGGYLARRCAECGERTHGRKPYCFAHVTMNPHAAEVTATLEAAELEAELGRWTEDGALAQTVLALLAERGEQSASQMTKYLADLHLEDPAKVESLLRWLRRRGRVVVRVSGGRKPRQVWSLA